MVLLPQIKACFSRPFFGRKKIVFRNILVKAKSMSIFKVKMMVGLFFVLLKVLKVNKGQHREIHEIQLRFQIPVACKAIMVHSSYIFSKPAYFLQIVCPNFDHFQDFVVVGNIFCSILYVKLPQSLNSSIIIHTLKSTGYFFGGVGGEKCSTFMGVRDIRVSFVVYIQGENKNPDP